MKNCWLENPFELFLLIERRRVTCRLVWNNRDWSAEISVVLGEKLFSISLWESVSIMCCGRSEWRVSIFAWSGTKAFHFYSRRYQELPINKRLLVELLDLHMATSWTRTFRNGRSKLSPHARPEWQPSFDVDANVRANPSKAGNCEPLDGKTNIDLTQKVCSDSVLCEWKWIFNYILSELIRSNLQDRFYWQSITTKPNSSLAHSLPPI